MNFLIIGGTRFQGRYLVDYLIKNSHRVTVFHKGSHSIGNRSGLKDIIGDRNNPEDLKKIPVYEFDACIDTCAYFPWQIDNLSKIVKTKKYCLISSVYVYKNQFTHLSETSELVDINDYSTIQLTPENYGALKTACERKARFYFGENCLIIRSAIIIGPGDHTERMSFWVRMALSNQLLLVPGNLERSIQFTDVRDLTEFTIKIITDNQSGAVNVSGRRYSFQRFIDELTRLSGKHCQIYNIDLVKFNQLHLNDLPFCYQDKSENYNSELAKSWGFQDRDLRDSLLDIYEHDKKKDFRLTKFQDLEKTILSLFS
jgi:2'-hydroxyisoflavone reductase